MHLVLFVFQFIAWFVHKMIFETFGSIRSPYWSQLKMISFLQLLGKQLLFGENQARVIVRTTATKLSTVIYHRQAMTSVV